MSEFMFAHLIDKKPVGAEIGKSCPLHMTTLHWFESDHPQDKIIDAAQLALSSITSIIARGSEESLFGPNQDLPVTKLEKTPELVRLHCGLLAAMRGLGIVITSQWVGAPNFNPHVTNKLLRRIQVGDEVAISDVDLITRASKDKIRKIIHRFYLN